MSNGSWAEIRRKEPVNENRKSGILSRRSVFRFIALATQLLSSAAFAASLNAGPTGAERFGSDGTAAWPTDILYWQTSPVDLSFLNAPEKAAGKHGFLKAVKDKLVFEDGTPVRFWGTNLTAYSLFGTTRENVKQQARRLSELGFNLVRLHHHDSPWVDPNIFGDRKSPDTQNLSSAMLDKLDWWIKCLKDEGIYLWLDLHVQRNLKPGDQIDGFEEIAKGKPSADLKGFNYVNRSIAESMNRFNEAYVTHGNNYTGLRYKDDPAIIAMLITNENDVTHHFGNGLLPDKNVPKHNALYMVQADPFAAKHGLPKDKSGARASMARPSSFSTISNIVSTWKSPLPPGMQPWLFKAWTETPSARPAPY